MYLPLLKIQAQSSAIILIEDSQPIGASLCKQVEDKSIDVLVLGNSGKGLVQRYITCYCNFLRWSVGSVSEYCVQNAKCVVVVVK